ncbi:MAG: hypothetical protein STSR0003_24270 [Smithella sp.]|jgi:predicted DNA-binding antitoxin AbrB/MazE fold protein
MMILHGIYENGVIKIKDKKLPMIRAEVDIIVKDKPWQRRIKKVKIKGEPVSETIIRARYEE